jgi:hypothetical protein
MKMSLKKFFITALFFHVAFPVFLAAKERTVVLQDMRWVRDKGFSPGEQIVGMGFQFTAPKTPGWSLSLGYRPNESVPCFVWFHKRGTKPHQAYDLKIVESWPYMGTSWEEFLSKRQRPSMNKRTPFKPGEKGVRTVEEKFSVIEKDGVKGLSTRELVELEKRLSWPIFHGLPTERSIGAFVNPVKSAV